MIPRTFQLFFLPVALIVCFGACNTLPIDPYETFNIVRSVDFPIPAAITTGRDTMITVRIAIDTTKEYSSNHTTASLLKTTEISRVVLHSTDASFSLDHLVYATLLLGADTVAFDSIPAGTGTDFPLTTRPIDVTTLVRNSSVPVSLGIKFLRAWGNPNTITASLTFTHTATRP